MASTKFSMEIWLTKPLFLSTILSFVLSRPHACLQEIFTYLCLLINVFSFSPFSFPLYLSHFSCVFFTEHSIFKNYSYCWNTHNSLILFLHFIQQYVFIIILLTMPERANSPPISIPPSSFSSSGQVRTWLLS